MPDPRKYERALARQALIHYHKRVEQMDRILADLIVHAKGRCECEVCAMLRDLGQQLEAK